MSNSVQGTVRSIDTVEYLKKKKDLQDSIHWYQKTIYEVDKQQGKRRRTLDDMQNQLYLLEKDYYTNG